MNVWLYVYYTIYIWMLAEARRHQNLWNRIMDGYEPPCGNSELGTKPEFPKEQVLLTAEVSLQPLPGSLWKTDSE